MKILKQAVMLSFCASVVLSGCAFKNDKNNIKKINLEQAQGKFENGYFKYYDYETLTSYNPREDDFESNPNFIAHFPFEINGNILKKSYKDDHDYFLFSIAKRKEINIDFQTTSDGVYFRLYKYGTNPLDNSIAFNMGFGSYDLILDPGSYYIEFSNYNSFTNSISYSLKCNSIVEYNSLDYSNISENFNRYGCVYWQNDKSPFNNSSFDDIFKTVHSFPNAHVPLCRESTRKYLYCFDKNQFLDSVWYIWDKEFMKTLVPYLDCMIKALQEQMINEVAERYDRDMVSLVVSTVENVLSYLPLPDWVDKVLSVFDSLNLIYNFSTWSNDKNYEINKMKTFTNTLIYLSRLREKCYELSLNVNDYRVIKITRYSTIIDNEYGFYCTRNFDCAFAKEGNAFDLVSDAEIFKSNVYDYQNNITYQGTFKLFRRAVSNNYDVFFDEEGIILDSRWNEFESTCECLDQNRHIVTYINGYKSIENHEMIYDEINGFHCSHCSFVSEPYSYITKTNLIGFGDVFDIDSTLRKIEITTDNGMLLSANGKRCGIYSNESGEEMFSLIATTQKTQQSYVEFYFNVPVAKVDFELSLLSLIPDSLQFNVYCDYVDWDDDDLEWNPDLYVDSKKMAISPNSKTYHFDNCGGYIQAFRIATNVSGTVPTVYADISPAFILDNIKLSFY